MYRVVADRDTDSEELIWEGESRSVADQKFNSYKNACEKGDFETLEIIRPMDGGGWAKERSFRFS